MASPETVGPLLDQVVARFRAVTSDDLVPSEMIKQSNLMLLELSRLPKARKQEFQELLQPLRALNYKVL